MSSFVDQIRRHNLSGNRQGIRDFIAGKRVRIVANYGSHNYGNIDDVIEFNNVSNMHIGGSSIEAGMVGGNNINFDEFVVIEKENKEYLNTSISDITARKEKLKSKYEKEVAKLDKSLKEVEDKITFIEEHKLEEFDPVQYKVLNILETFEDKELSKEDRIKMISGLVEY